MPFSILPYSRFPVRFAVSYDAEFRASAGFF